MLANALSGLKVIDFTQVMAGPTCTLCLADLGADVVKVEAPAGDLSRALSPWLHGEGVAFLALNRNKRSIVLDLKQPDHQQAARALIAQADVLVESFRPGVMARFGLDYAAVSAGNPRLIYCSVSAYGQHGASKDLPGVDGVLQAVSGLMSVTGARDGEPCKVPVPVVDLITGSLATISVLAALADRQRTGLGQHVEASMFASAIALQHVSFASYFADGQVPGPQGHAAPYSTPNEALRCADGWIMVAAYHPARWQALCAAIGAPELASDPRFADNRRRLQHREALLGLLEARMLAHPRAFWLQKFSAVDIICGPINNYAEVAQSAPFLEAALAEKLQHPVAGPLTLPRSVIGAVGERPRARRAAPTLGQHTREILAELGMPPGNVDALAAASPAQN
ncbi:crotonobetainyl-CoA:carnitine CoA-transferase CaiB-like acyl-CoA transferase [Variovorax sp. TBS-050B]|uniref:CaiB/BaiF CoA transferase family protein n=1 Tax=Variovorax sp. TBS-050B TaxID=2940551 RepID=UPI0024764ACA|nr:CoA transferase [Variovorax sp. TBS-050B]MDH6590132.1 crotonobetainyl-CoA:carnitine CoA-transferase CaiB-like acyl-CoA transferase [Variovorax sp. TBS-050B]